MARPVIVSACLLGLRTRYDGSAKKDEGMLKLALQRCLVPVCPEQLGGLPTPRPPSTFRGGDGDAVLDGTAKVINTDCCDVTREFINGAHAVLQIAHALGVREAYLKQRSPSCGRGRVKMNGRMRDGNGVCAALLLRNGIRIHTVD